MAAARLGVVCWSVLGGEREHWPRTWYDRKKTDACRNKKYTYVGIHNEYTLASTVIGTIRYYKT